MKNPARFSDDGLCSYCNNRPAAVGTLCIECDRRGELEAEHYKIREARYAKGQLLVLAPSDATGLKTRAMRLLGALKCRYTNRERGYVCSPAKAARFETLYREGWDASYFSDDLEPPKGTTSCLEKIAKTSSARGPGKRSYAGRRKKS